MSQESSAPTDEPRNLGAAENASQGRFTPPPDMKERNRRFGLVFLGIVAFLVVLTVVTRIMLSS